MRLSCTAKTHYQKFEQIVPEKELCGLKFPHPCVCERFFTIVLPILLQENMWTDGTEDAQFLFWEYINGIFVAEWDLSDSESNCCLVNIPVAHRSVFIYLMDVWGLTGI
jgi:hypothetical protein